MKALIKDLRIPKQWFGYIETTDEQFEKIKNKINKFKENKKLYRYNILALLCILFNIKMKHRKNHFYCAEFVKFVLDDANININLPEMPRPDSFEKLSNLKVIYTGLLNKYSLQN